MRSSPEYRPIAYNNFLICHIFYVFCNTFHANFPYITNFNLLFWDHGQRIGRELTITFLTSDNILYFCTRFDANFFYTTNSTSLFCDHGQRIGRKLAITFWYLIIFNFFTSLSTLIFSVYLIVISFFVMMARELAKSLQ